MPESPVIRFGRVTGGYLIQIAGCGTKFESPAFHLFVKRILETEPACTIALDLRSCQGLDSTCLGCIVAVHQACAPNSGGRFVVVATPDARSRLLAPMHLDRILTVTEQEPPAASHWLSLAAAQLGKADLARHVMECHRRLAETGGPQADAFGRIADELSRELDRHDAGDSRAGGGCDASG